MQYNIFTYGMQNDISDRFSGRLKTAELENEKEMLLIKQMSGRNG
jgi:hypothetical protein